VTKRRSGAKQVGARSVRPYVTVKVAVPLQRSLRTIAGFEGKTLQDTVAEMLSREVDAYASNLSPDWRRKLGRAQNS
jgi:hypothetical protein